MKFSQFGIRLVLTIVLFLNMGCCNKRQKKSKYSNSNAPKFDIFKGEFMPSDVQITTFLYKDQIKRLQYLSPVANRPLFLTIMTCSSLVEWNCEHQNSSLDFSISQNDQELLHSSEKFSTSDVSTEQLISKKGLFVISLLAKKSDTYAHVYLSTEENGSIALQNSNREKLELLRRQKRGTLTAKWEPSLVDPQGTEYCIVISQKKNYKTLCSAETDIYGITIPTSRNMQLTSSSQTIITWQPSLTVPENEMYPLIACLGPKTHYTATNLKHKELYYFTVFAIDRQTNLTYAHVSNATTFDKRIKPIILRDGKSTFTNLKKMDGLATFRFKVRKKIGATLRIFIMPCGKPVYVDVVINKNHIVIRKRIERFDKITIPNPVKNGRYNVKITASNTDEVDHAFGVEVFATTKSSAKIPFPELPSQTSVVEYESLKKCDSVTIGWLPSPRQKKVTYCITVQEKTVKESDEVFYGMPNQCGLENRLRKSVNFALKYCKETRQNFQNVITEKISQLSPGKSYFIQVTVNKPNGKILSYDLLQVHTSLSCVDSL